MNKSLLAICCVSLVLTTSCTYLGNSVPEVTDSEFAASYRKDLATLASDEFEGRRPGTPGGEKTVNFLVESFKSIGLEPGNNGSYLQEVKLKKTISSTKSNTLISSDSSTLELEPMIHMTTSIRGGANKLILLETEVVFVGFGVVAPEYGWDDYAGVDVKNKIVITLWSNPGTASGDTTIFTGPDGRRHGFNSTKRKLALEHGVAGIITIFDSTLTRSRFNWKRIIAFSSRGRSELDIEGADTSKSILSGAINLEISKEFMKLAGYDYDSLLVAAYTPGFRSFDLGVKLSGNYSADITRYSSYNILGLLPGAKRPDEIVIYTAHWDHLGIDKNLEGDQIYNGAADNGTGTAAILNLARAFTSLPNETDRSILFMGFTAEEMGLLGSKHYGDNPVFPLNKSVAALNIDMLKFVGPTNDIIVYGMGKSELDDYAAKAAKKAGIHLIGDRHPEQRIYFRSDHINLARKGLPATFMDMGVDSREHGQEWGIAYDDGINKRYYHKVSDEYSDTLNVDGIMQFLQVMFDMGYSLANSDKFPNWSIDDEFRPLRDEMMKSTDMSGHTP